MAKKKTGYFVEDNADIMARLGAGTATAEQQKLAASALMEADTYQDSYFYCADQIEPYTARPHRPDGGLPASVGESLTILLEFWNRNKANPACDEEFMADIRKALTVGARYSLDPCIKALAKLDSVTTSTVIQRIARAAPKASYFAPGFPSRLTALRAKAGLTQDELARKIVAPLAAVQGYENGVKNPQPRTLRRLATALKVSLTALVDGEPEPAIGVSSVKKRSVDEDSE